MTIKNILVHIDHSKACEHRVRAAIELARGYDARLSALFVVPDYFVPSYVEAQISADVIAQICDQAVASAKETQGKFKAQVKDAGLELDCYIEEGNIISIISDYARYSDLLILGQSQSDDPHNISEGLADHLVLEGGAPCLVIPYIGTRQTLGKRLLLAWNESRESSRALRDALPLLQAADAVSVLLIKPKSHNEKHTATQGKIITSYLSDHGVDANINLCVDNHFDPGDTILAQASDNDIDLIVMGAYGHSRLRELVLGGATRHLLKEMTVPVFISH
ncbi:MAG: universal stress protein [Gammaproteobacteria bacterium]|nr:universal stress protein [Gammaproteobacteria bacterium]